MTCSKCQSESAGNGKFCEECGAPLSKESKVPKMAVAASGRTKIQLDQTTMNIILREFASSEDMALSYEGGEIVVDKGAVKLSVCHLPLKDTQLKVDGKFGVVHLGVADFRLEASQVELDLEVGLEK